jgi:MoaA/NifB/PqqE/SkfB family radical SAM enzyme
MSLKDRAENILKSKTFCSHLALSATVYPGGNWVPCCKANGADLHNENLEKLNYNEYTNSNSFKKVKDEIIEGRTDGYCRSCFVSEQNNDVSDRVSNNENWLRHLEKTNEYEDFLKRAEEYYDNKQNTAPWHWFLFIDNNCQARCVMCDATFSSAIEKEYEKLNLPINFMSKNKSNNLGKNTINFEKIIDRIKDNIEDVKIIQLLGGEPTLQTGYIKLFNWLIETGHSKNITVKINTNGINLPQTWLDFSKHFKFWQWTFSVDAVGDLNEWLRYPTNWERLCENIEKARNTDAYVMINTTVHALNIHYLPELYQWLKDKNLPKLCYHYVNEPKEISVFVLTNEQRKQLKKKYSMFSQFMEDHGERILTHVMNLKQMENTELQEFIKIIQEKRFCKFSEVNSFF